MFYEANQNIKVARFRDHSVNVHAAVQMQSVVKGTTIIRQLPQNVNVKSFPSFTVHRAALISIS